MEKIRHGEVTIYSFKRTIPLIIIIISILLLWWISTYQSTTHLPDLQTTYPSTFLADVCKTGVFWEGKHLMKWLLCLQVPISLHLWHKYKTKLFIFSFQMHTSFTGHALIPLLTEENSLSPIPYFFLLWKTLCSTIGQMFMKQNLLHVLFEYAR